MVDSTVRMNWSGDEEMTAALQSLCKQRPVAASKIKTAAKIALKHSPEYKMAVHHIESFIRKADSMDKLCGIYVLDAICRQPKSLVLYIKITYYIIINGIICFVITVVINE